MAHLERGSHFYSLGIHIGRVRHNLCHGNILEYINKESGDDYPFFTPECCLKLAVYLGAISKSWVQELGKFRHATLMQIA